MANIKSQIKRNRQNEKRRLRNRDFRGAARTAVKDARTSFESGENTPAAVMAAISALDKAAQRGAIHPRNASRRKGRLMKRLAALGGQPGSSMAKPMMAEGSPEKEAAKKPAKVEKEAKPVEAPKEKETKPKAEAKKPAEKKTAVKKTAEKKPAAKTAAKKTAKK